MKCLSKQSKFYPSLLIAGFLVIGIYLLWQQHNYNLREDAQQKIQNSTQQELLIAQKNENISLLTGKLLDDIKKKFLHDPNHELNQITLKQLSDYADAIKPYPIQTNDTITSNKTSPEKGQLFRTLANAVMPLNQWAKIIKDIDFSFAELKGINLSNYNIEEVKLEGADLKKSNLSATSIKCAVLNKANLWGANLSGSHGTSVQLQHALLNWANLNGVSFLNSQFGSAHLNNSNFVAADLSGSNMRFCQLKGALLNKANLEKVNLLWTDLSRSSLKSTNLKKTKLRSCNLEDVDFNGADMRGALLWDANFNRSILTNVRLDSAIVKEFNWFDKLENWNVIGVDEIKESYILTPHNYANGSFMLQKIKT